MNALGIDIGSSSIKAAVLDLESGQLRSTEVRAFPKPRSPHLLGYFTIEFDSIMQEVESVIEALLESEHGRAAESLFVSCQMGGLVHGSSSSKCGWEYISWRDTRSVQETAGATRFFDDSLRKIGSECLKTLGNELKPGSTLVLLAWLQSQGQCGRLQSWGTLGSMVLARLTQNTPVVHSCEAIGLWDLRDGSFHHEAFHRLGLNGIALPNQTHAMNPVGVLTCRRKLLQVYPAIGDHPCSLMGVGLNEGELSINISTGSQTTVLTPELRLGDWQTRYSADGRYLNTLTHLPAGRSLDALVELINPFGALSSRDVWARIQREIDSVPGGSDDLEIDLAFFEGPMGSCGSISNIRLDNWKVGSLFRAAFRNMADNYRSCARRLDPSESWNSVLLSGGLSQRFPYLRDQIQKRFDAPMRETPEGDDALLGLLHLARSTLVKPSKEYSL